MEEPIKVNLGSGKNAVEGWINIDHAWNILLSKHPFLKFVLFKLRVISEKTYQTNWDKEIKRHNIRKRLPFNNECVDYVYCSHVLEHFSRKEARKVCQEVYRVLKPNGVFRVVVPDLKLLAQKYIDGDKAFFGNKKEPIANQFINKTLLVKGEAPTFFERFFAHYHKWMYDSESLHYLLREAGFDTDNIFECEYRKGKCPDLEKIETHEKSVYMEATK